MGSNTMVVKVDGLMGLSVSVGVWVFDIMMKVLFVVRSSPNLSRFTAGFNASMIPLHSRHRRG